MFIFICTLVLSIFKSFQVDMSSFMFFSSLSDSALYPDMDSDIHSWESFLSDVREEIEKAKVSYMVFYHSVKICLMVILKHIVSY